MVKHISFILNICALALFVPGILLPIFSLNMDIIADISGATMTTQAVTKELSILTTVEELWHDNRLLVAFLILFFSVFIPILKTFMVLIAYLKKTTQIEKRLVSFVNAIGKWSMADVFVVAVFLAVLSTNQAETQSAQQITLFGFKIDFIVGSETVSNIGNGFYFFTAYCLLSLLSTNIYGWALKNDVVIKAPTSQDQNDSISVGNS